MNALRGGGDHPPTTGVGACNRLPTTDVWIIAAPLAVQFF